MMETIESFSDFLKKIGTPNLLAIGIVVMVIWLLISGFRKGLKKRKPDKEPEDNSKPDGEE